MNSTFSGVTINSSASTTVTASNSGLNTVQFIGNYSPVMLDGGDKSSLYLGADNTLYWPSSTMTINAFRAYFTVDLNGTAGVRAFVINIGDNDETTGIVTTYYTNYTNYSDYSDYTNYTNYSDYSDYTNYSDYTAKASAWHSLDGRKLQSKPTQR